MKIFNIEIKRAKKKKAAVKQEHFAWNNPDLRQRVITVGGHQMFLWDTDDFDSSRADRIDANFSRSVRITCDAISSLPVILKRDAEAIDDHEFLELIRKPHSFIRFDELIKHAVQGMMVGGKSYWRFDAGIGLTIKTPTQILPVVPSVMSVKFVDGLPKAFSMQTASKIIEIPLEEIVYFKMYDMRTPFQGAGLVDAIKDVIGD